MSARYKTISGLLGFVDPVHGEGTSRMEIEILPEPAADAGPSRRTRKRDSLRVMSVRNLVNKIETRATESLERNFGGRFSGRLRKGKRAEDGTSSAAGDQKEAPKIPHGTSSSTGQPPTWYMVHLSPDRESTNNNDDDLQHVDDNQQAVIEHDKISADSAEFSQR
ncbi:AGAP011558-PA-like protein [Anopheles sinensis]|uniref:AGAP011558-PA-like protein n=1 Tax=Anopheles sinensis TaxID=74873 RepID=A0A084W1G2_ANOSI|nr:AGAP011558-PA-like protein [Anopheles sinensis]